jgi:hypothetical protein
MSVPIKNHGKHPGKLSSLVSSSDADDTYLAYFLLDHSMTESSIAIYSLVSLQHLQLKSYLEAAMQHGRRSFRLFVAASLFVFFTMQLTYAKPQRQRRAKTDVGKRENPYAETVARINEYQRQNLELLRQEIIDLTKVYGELGVDLIQLSGTESIRKAINQMRLLVDTTNSVYRTAEAQAKGSTALAWSNALEGLLTLAALPFELNPEFKTYPAYTMFIGPLDKSVTAINISARLIEASKHSVNLDVLLENQRNLNSAMMKVRELQKAYRSINATQGRLKPRETDNDSDTTTINEALSRFYNNLDDAVEVLGYKESGDRYFDGRPEEWQRFLAKHPEYKQGLNPVQPPIEIPVSPSPLEDKSELCVWSKKELLADLKRRTAICAYHGSECFNNWTLAVRADERAVEQFCKDAELFLRQVRKKENERP